MRRSGAPAASPRDRAQTATAAAGTSVSVATGAKRRDAATPVAIPAKSASHEPRLKVR